jgi:hypothetical protein
MDPHSNHQRRNLMYIVYFPSDRCNFEVDATRKSNRHHHSWLDGEAISLTSMSSLNVS